MFKKRFYRCPTLNLSRLYLFKKGVRPDTDYIGRGRDGGERGELYGCNFVSVRDVTVLVSMGQNLSSIQGLKSANT